MLFIKVLIFHMTETGDMNWNMSSTQCLFSHLLFALLQPEDDNI